MNKIIYRYRGYKVHIEECDSIWYGNAYFNGACFNSNIKGLCWQTCSHKCKKWIDNQEYLGE